MFDLEQEIARWRREMREGGVADSSVLDELESHLRDYVEERRRSGGDVGQAFIAGVARLGRPAVLKREFARAKHVLGVGRLAAILDDRRKCGWISLGLAALVAVGYYAWDMRATPIYASAATVQVFDPLRGAPGATRQSDAANDVQFAEILNTSLKLLVSDRLRAAVADSITPAERVVLLRPAVMHRGAPGYSSRWVGDWLGTLAVWPRRLTGMITISVRHEDPEAAALVANRYAKQLQAEFDRGFTRPRISMRQVDVAEPNREPFVPNSGQILQASAGLGLVTLVGLLALAALFRKLVRVRPRVGPQFEVE